MSKITDAIKNSGKAFVPFITGGDPDLETTIKLILAMQEAGADVIEVGIPFSDPIAEGSVIQEADLRALNAGTTTDKLFEALKSIKNDVKIPLVFMTYANVIFKYGSAKFMERCVECGISGIIVPDCPFEERDEFGPYCKQHNIDYIPLIAPTSKERIKDIAKTAEGFVYVVSSLGVTGVRENITTDLKSMIDLVREVTDVPAMVGFGISTPEKASEISKDSDGVIVGSAIVRIVSEHGRESVTPVFDYVKSMKEAVLSAR